MASRFDAAMTSQNTFGSIIGMRSAIGRTLRSGGRVDRGAALEQGELLEKLADLLGGLLLGGLLLVLQLLERQAMLVGFQALLLGFALSGLTGLDLLGHGLVEILLVLAEL